MNLCIYCAGGLGKEVFDIATRINKIHSIWDEIFFVADEVFKLEMLNIVLSEFDEIQNNMNKY